jgi:hypothetical protein
MLNSPILDSYPMGQAPMQYELFFGSEFGIEN